MDNGYNYPLNILIALDQLLNAVLLGSCDETLSSRIYRGSTSGVVFWKGAEAVVNCVFFFDRDALGRKHCELSYISEVLRKHLPEIFSLEGCNGD